MNDGPDKPTRSTVRIWGLLALNVGRGAPETATPEMIAVNGFLMPF